MCLYILCHAVIVRKLKARRSKRVHHFIGKVGRLRKEKVSARCEKKIKLINIFHDSCTRGNGSFQSRSTQNLLSFLLVNNLRNINKITF